MIWSREDHTSNWVKNRILILLITPLFMIMVGVRSRRKRINQSQCLNVYYGPCDWLVLQVLLPTPIILFSLDHKWQSCKWNQKKWKRSDPSNPDQSSLWLFSVFMWRHHFPKLKITNPSAVLVSSDIRGGFSIGQKRSYRSRFRKLNSSYNKRSTTSHVSAL